MHGTAIALAAAFGAVALFGTANAGSVSLNDANFEAEVFDSEKNAFVNFNAPWCGHCKRIKPFWAELGDEYEDSASVIIGNVDCTAEADLCLQQGVDSYPTLKYYLTGEKEGKKYEKGQDLESFRSFTVDTLEVPCLIKETSGCTKKEMKFLEAFKAKHPADIKKEYSRLKGVAGDRMKPDVRLWVKQRAAILKQLDAAA